MGDPFEFRQVPSVKAMRRRVRWAIIINVALWAVIFLTMRGCLL